MGTLVIVHGAGVRGTGIERLEQNIRNGIAGLDAATPGAAALQKLQVSVCAWGPEEGARPTAVEDTLPAEVITRAVAPAPDEDTLEAARWALLFDDPLFELRIVAQAPEADGEGPRIGEDLPAQVAIDMVRGLAEDTGLPPDRMGIDRAEFAEAISFVADSTELSDAANALGSAVDSDFALMIGRAITAELLTRHREDPPGTAPPVVESSTLRDELVATLAAQMVPVETRGVADWAKQQIAGFLMRKGTAIAADHRRRAQEGSMGLVGDVVYYLRRGGRIAGIVERSLREASPPVLALGHSLGGIVLVDVLSRSQRPAVDLLVTVGSQSPILFAYDALERSREGRDGAAPFSREAPPFTPWLNIYNRNDFVSFLAANVFRDYVAGDAIVDRELHVPEAFPAAHGAYWFDRWTFEFIAEQVAGIPAFEG